MVVAAEHCALKSPLIAPCSAASRGDVDAGRSMQKGSITVLRTPDAVAHEECRLARADDRADL